MVAVRILRQCCCLGGMALAVWITPCFGTRSLPPESARPSYTRASPSILRELDDERIGLLEKLNRADRRHLPRLPALVVPDQWELDEAAYSPMPNYSSWSARYPKALIVHLPGQVFGAYEEGRLVRWGPVNSGSARSPTPSGRFSLRWKSPDRRSSINRNWRMKWYYNFFHGVAFHQYSLPGAPVSHACVRMLARDAKWLYHWGEPGTPVLVLGRYDFSAPRPWLKPEWAARGVALPGENRAAE